MRRLAACIVWLALLMPTRALAQSSTLERAKASFKAGATAYAAGDYAAAIQALDAAYTMTPLPAIAFSLAQAHRRHYFVARQPADLERAIELFRRYVKQVPAGGRRADALDALSQLEPLAATVLQNEEKRDTKDERTEQRTRLMIVAEAPSARVSLDGTKPAPAPLIREVEPGKHRIKVEAPGFFPAEREVTAVSGELVLSEISLRERPSSLVISSSSGSELYIDGAYVGPGGEEVMIRLPSGTHKLAVAEKGRQSFFRTLKLERGKTHTLSVTLEATRQRNLAKGLFIAGAGAFSTGLVLSALAMGYENDAQQFLGQQSRRNVSDEARTNYTSAVADRDRFRLGALASFGASVGFILTGLFLYELDEPSSQDIERRARTPQREEPPNQAREEAHVRVLPSVSTNDFGALIQGVF